MSSTDRSLGLNKNNINSPEDELHQSRDRSMQCGCYISHWVNSSGSFTELFNVSYSVIVDSHYRALVTYQSWLESGSLITSRDGSRWHHTLPWQQAVVPRHGSGQTLTCHRPLISCVEIRFSLVSSCCQLTRSLCFSYTKYFNLIREWQTKRWFICWLLRAIRLVNLSRALDKSW